MDIKKTFELYTGLYAVSISTFSSSFAQTNYLITSNLAQDYIMSVPDKNVNLKKLYNQQYKVLKLLRDKKIDNKTIFFDKDSGIKISKYKGEIASQKEIVDNYITFIKCLKTFHNIDYSQTSIKEFSPLEYYNYLKTKIGKINLDSEIEEKILNNAKKAYENCERKVLCHNNLSLHNIINSEDKYIFISTQLASIGDPLYDLANFFFKAKITNKVIIEKFLKRYIGSSYDEKHYQQVKTYMQLATLLYAVWNQYLYSVNEVEYEKQKSDKLFAQLSNLKIEID